MHLPEGHALQLAQRLRILVVGIERRMLDRIDATAHAHGLQEGGKLAHRVGILGHVSGRRHRNEDGRGGGVLHQRLVELDAGLKTRMPGEIDAEAILLAHAETHAQHFLQIARESGHPGRRISDGDIVEMREANEHVALAVRHVCHAARFPSADGSRCPGTIHSDGAKCERLKGRIPAGITGISSRGDGAIFRGRNGHRGNAPPAVGL